MRERLVEYGEHRETGYNDDCLVRCESYKSDEGRLEIVDGHEGEDIYLF